ncbi:Uncharacterised protein [Mycobacteroides abscessus subsp. abscessus]|nr:Uncharacterised protein [Mycobacteroides abscessus subsp. abscessus]
MASAPAARSSLTMSSSASGPSPCPGSLMVRMTPGPVAPTVPTMIDSADSRALASLITA